MSAPATTERPGAAGRPSRFRAAIAPPARALALPAMLLVLWEISAHSGLAGPDVCPSLERIVGRALSEITRDAFLSHLWASLRRDLIGFGLGGTVGIAVGLAVGFSVLLQRLFAPILLLHRQIALFAWVPLISLWFGGGETGKIAFVALAAFQPSLVNTWQGVASIPRQYRELADTWTYGAVDYLGFIALPAALPSVFSGLQAALIYGWSATVGAELLFNLAPGLGGRMNEGQQLFQMDLLLLCLATLGGVGMILNLLTTALERRLLRWRTP